MHSQKPSLSSKLSTDFPLHLEGKSPNPQQVHHGRRCEIGPPAPPLEFDLPYGPPSLGSSILMFLPFLKHTKCISTAKLCTYFAVFSAYLLLPCSSSSLLKYHFLGEAFPNHPFSKMIAPSPRTSTPFSTGYLLPQHLFSSTASLPPE